MRMAIDPAKRAAARNAGWRKADLRWEALQEAAHAAYAEGREADAILLWRRALRLARKRFGAADPRRVNSLANAAFADRLAGNAARAARRYAKAMALWRAVPAWIETMHYARRARSSLFHLRLEAKHWDTYQANMRTRMNRFAAETAEALAAIADGKPSPHRLVGRWKAEKPAIHDDARKFLAAALLLASPDA